MKKIMFIILIIVFVLVGCKEENKNDNNDNLEIKESEQNTVDKNESDEDNKKEDEIIDDSYNIEESEKIMALDNGEILYYGKYRSLFVNKDDSKTILSDYGSSYPEISTDKSRIAYIDEVSFESIGNLYVYDIQTKDNMQKTTYGYDQSETVKSIEWISDDSLLVVIGFAFGTVTQGGDLYLYDINENKLTLLLESEKYMEIKDAVVENDIVTITKVIWKDDNYLEYNEIREEKSIEELL